MSDNIKDNKKDAENKNSSYIAVFNKFNDVFSNDHHGYLARKVERLTSALYVITGFIAHDEPVRNRLRTASLDLIALTSHPHSFTAEGTESFRGRAVEIGALLQTAHTAGLISRMNAELLQTEYANLAAFVKDQAEAIRVSNQDVGTEVTPIRHNKVELLPGKSKKVREGFKGQIKQNGQKGQDYRRKVILELINKKDKISIKDAASAIADCSEKTIQRELLSLVRDGLVVKEGERRWSTYRRVSAVSD